MATPILASCVVSSRQWMPRPPAMNGGNSHPIIATFTGSCSLLLAAVGSGAALYVAPVFVHDVYEGGMRPDQRRDGGVLAGARVELLGQQQRGARGLGGPLQELPRPFGAAQHEVCLGEPERADDPRVLGTVVGVPLVAGDPAGGLHPEALL